MTDQLVQSLKVIRARDLRIWGSEIIHYWKWETRNMQGHGPIDVAVLIKVMWLIITGKYDPTNLTVGANYEVNVVVELKDNFVMNGPVTLTLVHGTRKDRTEDLSRMTKNQEIKLKVGEFTAQRNCDVTFAMTNFTGSWQQGLVVIGASISAKV